VETAPCPTLHSFFNQRKRWASKTKSYTDPQILLVGAIVLSVCLALIINLFVGIFYPKYLLVAGIIFTLKTLVDSLLLIRCADFFAIRKTLTRIPILAAVYPFYVVVSAVGGLLGWFRWKE
jgi:hypothetical protein